MTKVLPGNRVEFTAPELPKAWTMEKAKQRRNDHEYHSAL
jgi:hypothetical protein